MTAGTAGTGGAGGTATPPRLEPPVGAESGPFWEATREGRLLVQWCTACDRGIFYPRTLCPWCGAAEGPGAGTGTGTGADGGGALEWRQASGRATVHAAVVEHRPELAGASSPVVSPTASPW